MSDETIKVLLVEDNPGDALFLEQTLHESQSPGYKVSWVVSLEKAKASLLADSFDVVLLDLTLPDSYGLETVRRAKAAAPTAPIVLLTGVEDEVMARQAIDIGAREYLVKGRLSAAVITGCIRRAMGHGKAAAGVPAAARGR